VVSKAVTLRGGEWRTCAKADEGRTRVTQMKVLHPLLALGALRAKISGSAYVEMKGSLESLLWNWEQSTRTSGGRRRRQSSTTSYSTELCPPHTGIMNVSSARSVTFIRM
jgi:hypothetical protein